MQRNREPEIEYSDLGAGSCPLNASLIVFPQESVLVLDIGLAKG